MMSVDEIFQRKAGVDKLFDGFVAVPVHIAIDARRVIGHLIEHPPVGRSEPGIVFEKVAVTVDVSDHEFLVGDFVVEQQIGIARISIDHHLVDFLQAVGIAFHQFIELGSETPVRIAGGEPAVGRQKTHFFVVDHLENHIEEVEAVARGVSFHVSLDAADFGRKWSMSHGIGCSRDPEHEWKVNIAARSVSETMLRQIRRLRVGL